MNRSLVILSVLLLLPTSGSAAPEESADPPDPAAAASEEAPVDAKDASSEATEGTEVGQDDAADAAETAAPADGKTSDSEQTDSEEPFPMADGIVEDASRRVRDVARTLDRNETVQEASRGLLDPIYDFSLSTTSPEFYWAGFALTSAGIISYSLQLVLSKLLLLFRGSINLREIVSDAVGLAISAIGLILVTQAAIDHESFADSPSSVLSAASVGIVAGLILYRWNHREESDALHGRRRRKRRGRK